MLLISRRDRSKRILMLLMAMPAVGHFTELILSESYDGPRARALNEHLTTSLGDLSQQSTQDLRSAVAIVDEAVRTSSSSEQGQEARIEIASLLVRESLEGEVEFGARVDKVVAELAERVALMNRALFDSNVDEPVTSGYKVFHPWNVVSVRQSGGKTVNRQYPLILDGGAWSLSSAMNTYGGTSGGYDPLAEFDYYASHFARRRLLVPRG